jgi:hypothetical protein
VSIQSLLSKAANGSGFNATSPSYIRPSKAGQPAVALALTHLVFSKLPQPNDHPTPLNQLLTNMSIGTGFLFEAAALPYLCHLYPDYGIEEQPLFEWESFSGRADYMLVSPDGTHVVVVDCKAFGIGTLREINERKLAPGWGYPTQLAIYGMGASNLYPQADIELMWCCFASATRKVFNVNLAPNRVVDLATSAQLRVVFVQTVDELAKAGKFAEAAHLLSSAPYTEQLPNKGNFYGNLCASSPFHYTPYADLFYPAEDPDGLPLAGEDLHRLAEAMLRHAYTGTNQPDYQSYVASLAA